MGSIRPDVRTQFRDLRGTVLIGLTLVVGVLAIVMGAASATGTELSTLLRDPLAVVDADPWVGFMSNLGIVLWSASAGMCLLAAYVLRNSGRTAVAPFFLSSALLTALLTLDDLFQLHEEVVPSLLGHGQRAVILGYVVLVTAYVWHYRAIIGAADNLLLAIAGVGFAISIAVDLIPAELWDGALATVLRLAEDGGKFLGIVFWVLFFLRTCADHLSPVITAEDLEARLETID